MSSKRHPASRMAATDAMFWYAESAMPIFRPIIAGLYLLDGPLTPRELDHCVQRAIGAVPRLQQRVLEMPMHIGLPEWVHDEHFDVAYHVRHVSLPSGGRKRDLLDLTAALFATPLDRERPLWEAYGIEGLEGGRTALFWKMHHSMVDGVGSLAILNALSQPKPEVVQRRNNVGPKSRTHTVQPSAAARLARLASHNARESAKLVVRAATTPWQLMRHPVESAQEATRAIRGLGGALSDLAAPVIDDPIASNSCGLSRRFDIFDVPTARLKAIKAPLGVTINDVVLTALAGTLGRYHRHRRIHLESLNCMVPINLRSAKDAGALGNQVGTLTISLPVAEKNARKRLERIIEQTRAAKADHRGENYPLLAETAAMVPGFLLRWVAKQSLGKINVACTNVPGMTETRYMAGARVDAIHPFASVVEGTPLVMALLSYDGTFHIGIDTDPEAIPDPHRIAELFEDSLDELEGLSRRPVRRRTDTPSPTQERNAPPN